VKKLLLSMYIMRTENEIFISTPHVETKWWKELWYTKIKYNNFTLMVTSSYSSPMMGGFYLTTSPSPTYNKLQYHMYHAGNPMEYINNLIMVIFKATFYILKKRLSRSV